MLTSYHRIVRLLIVILLFLTPRVATSENLSIEPIIIPTTTPQQTHSTNNHITPMLLAFPSSNPMPLFITPPLGVVNSPTLLTVPVNEPTPLPIAPTARDTEATIVLTNEKPPNEIVHKLETSVLDDILTITTVVVSIVALFVSIRSYRKTTELTLETLKLQKEQNIDNVRPVLAVHLDANDISITITNHGLGPVVLKAMEYIDTVNKHQAKTLIELLLKKHTSFQTQTKLAIKYCYTKPFDGNDLDPDILAPQESLIFIRCEPNDLEPEERNLLYELFRDVTMKIVYTDVYNSKEWILQKDLSWFARWVSDKN